MNVTNDLDLINLDRLNYAKKYQKRYYNIIFLWWQQMGFFGKTDG